MTARRRPWGVQPSPTRESSHALDVGLRDGAAEGDRAGDPACWAELLCPDCGAVLSEGHQQGCLREGSG